MQTSLVPRPSYCPVFAKRPGPFYQVNDTSVYLHVGIPVDSGGEGSPNKRMSLRPFLVISVSSAGVFECLLSENALVLVQNNECVRKMQLGTPPPLAV